MKISCGKRYESKISKNGLFEGDIVIPYYTLDDYIGFKRTDGMEFTWTMIMFFNQFKEANDTVDEKREEDE